MAQCGFLFEACVDSLFSAIQAEKGGAGRLELCAALSQGGITPSYGMIKAVLDRVRIPVHVLIRPRAGDFCYTEDEIDVICEDIHMAGNLKVHGIAFGALTPDGDIDLQVMTRIISLCKRYELSMTFHRAFDATRNAEKSLQTLLELGVPRVLTSGQGETVTEGLPLLKVLVENSMQRISIMPGAGGITKDNAARIVSALDVTELHGSARSASDFGQSFVNETITLAMLGTATLMVADCEKVRAIVQACKEARHNYPA
ncbi:hypothetical protein SELMODRAFT_115204 [Selaginella moellendorffii]|uniref:Copper homeostasis protein cutC homolog n=1 Tax=Selaginella moellendorffii TaxID=88036 RepID=D8SEK3_SELML|nr:hypothetical protein SELMODRAFT_115204 [Selaginella moellendorffii]